MEIDEFIGKYRNHPVLFCGAGMSLRYLENSYSWDGLLSKLSRDLFGDEKKYLDIKYRAKNNGGYDYAAIATELEDCFERILSSEAPERFEQVNNVFYEKMSSGISTSRLKIYLAEILKELNFKAGIEEELKSLKKARKNVGSIITTNYDLMLEELFDFSPLVGNDILLSNPYGAIYKIHGCVAKPDKIIITSRDYAVFDRNYELIRAQLISLFIHNPIIFLGYGVGDSNIKDILGTIFNYVDRDSEIAKKVQSNFLLVEYCADTNSRKILEHDIVLSDEIVVRINKIKTNDFSSIYEGVSALKLPVSAMDVKRVQDLVQEIYSGSKDDGSSIRVVIAEDVDSLKNSDKVLAIGSSKTIYTYMTSKNFIIDYFRLVKERNESIIKLIDDVVISKEQWFPCYAYSIVCTSLSKAEVLKEQQKEKILTLYNKAKEVKGGVPVYHSISDIEREELAKSKHEGIIFFNVLEDNISADNLLIHLDGIEDKNNTGYKRLLCLYDYVVNK